MITSEIEGTHRIASLPMRVPLPPRTPAALWQPRLLAPPVSWSRRQSTSLVLATGRRPHGAGDGEECAGGSGSPRPAGSSASSSSADREWQRVEQIQAAWQEIEERKLRLEGLVERQDFGAAAAERDALRHLQLSARRLELAAAADAKAGAGVRHQLGGVIVHARYNYRGVIVGYDPICCAPDEWCQVRRRRVQHVLCRKGTSKLNSASQSKTELYAGIPGLTSPRRPRWPHARACR